MKILQINTTINSGSTGRIAEEIGLFLLKEGFESYIAAAHTSQPSLSKVITVGNKFDRRLHGLKTRMFDRHGFGSAGVTQQFVKYLKEIEPDIVHLHNIHGYYLNIEILFNHIKRTGLPVVWTLHDCWPFTGHCSFFDSVNCHRWENKCHHCPNLSGYPKSWFFDNTRNNFLKKRELFSSVNNLTIVTPSQWLADHVSHSYLKEHPLKVIHNGIDLHTFLPLYKNNIRIKYQLNDKPFILGVASIWDKRKGLADFMRLRKLLKSDVQFVLVGLSASQIRTLPAGIIGISRTEDTRELAALYSEAIVFVNPTYVDNFPTTNLEALACGTPVITYATGGSPEAIDKSTGLVIKKGDVSGLSDAINRVLHSNKKDYSTLCRSRAETYFDKDIQYSQYLDLYKEIMHVS